MRKSVFFVGLLMLIVGPVWAAGPDIAVDDIVIESWSGTTTYTDPDGNAGSISVSSQHTTAEIAASPYFDEEQYVLAKARSMVLNGKAPDLASARAKFESNWTGDMIDHYLLYGASEDLNPSNIFDNSAYISFVAAKEGRDLAEVRAEFNASGVSPLRDFLERGQHLGYDAPVVPAEEQVDSGGEATYYVYDRLGRIKKIIRVTRDLIAQ